MSDRRQCEFFLLRYVPDAVKDEFVNIGVVVLEQGSNGSGGFAGVRFTRDWRRVRCLDPEADLEMLQALEQEIQKGLADAAARATFLAKIRDSFSGAVQLSPAKALLAAHPEDELNTLAASYLEVKRPRAERGASGARRRLFTRMRDTFEQYGVWQRMTHEIRAADFTRAGDPLKIDCGYRPEGNGHLRMFQAVSLAAGADAAKLLAFSFPRMAEGIARVNKLEAELTAVVEDGLDRAHEPIAFALDVLQQSRIAVAPAADLPRLAEMARRELRV